MTDMSWRKGITLTGGPSSSTKENVGLGRQTERDGGARAYAALLGWLAGASAWASQVEAGAGQRWGGLLLGLQDRGSGP